MIEALTAIFVFVFGAMVGSFLNVCIHRMPLGKSIVSPPSSCPKCGSAIEFYDNIPILSYVFLRARCRRCGEPISARYPAVEALAGGLILALYLKFGFTPKAAVYALFAAALIAAAFIDIDHRIIPNSITLPGIPLGFVLYVLMNINTPARAAFESAAGILLGGLLPFAIAWLYHAVTGVEGMGGGDIKFLAAIGAFTGWKGAVFALFCGAFIGALAGIAIMAVWGKNSKYAVPFGPFLAFGALAYIFFGEAIASWYISLVWRV